MVEVKDTDHSWFGDFQHAKNGWYTAPTTGGMAGAHVRESGKIASGPQTPPYRPTPGKNPSAPVHSTSSVNHTSGSTTPVRPASATVGWISRFLEMMAVALALAMAVIGFWVSAFHNPEFATMVWWKRGLAAIAIGLGCAGLTYGFLNWFVEFAVDVLFPIVLRLALFAMFLCGLFLVASALL